MPSGDTAVAVARHADVRMVMSDPRFSRNLTYPGAPRMLPGEDISDDPDMMINMDPPRHTRLRHLVSRAFTPRRIESLRPRATEVTEELIDDLLARTPPTDFVTAFAMPLPVRIICDLLGVPIEDRERFQAWSNAFLSTTAMSPEERGTANQEFAAYVARLVDDRRRHPGTALIDELINARDDDGALSEGELVRMTLALIVGGHETTVSFLTKGLLLLLVHPRQFELLAADPASIPSAVEEILRYDVPNDGAMLRVATEDVALPSGTVHKGEAVLPLLTVANRDTTVFPDPDRFDVTRSDNPHLVFGHGPHFCLGAHLARLELQVAIGALARRLPNLRLATSPDELTWKSGVFLPAPEGLPITW
ncbi:MAG TPA: cytochrome P450 [Streptosporangiaceae bacterium]|jgi:cytochrome P450